MEPKTTWPGAFGVFKTSRKAVGLNLWPLLALYALMIVASVIVGAITGTNNPENHAPFGQQVAAQLLHLVVGALLGVPIIELLLAGIAGRKLSFGDSFKRVGTLVVPYLGLTVLSGIIIILSVLALIVPFFFILPRIILAPYYLIDRELGPVEAIKASWNATKGHAGKVWGILGATIVMILPAFTIIGIPVALYLVFAYLAAVPLLYRFISQQPAPASEPAAS